VVAGSILSCFLSAEVIFDLSMISTVVIAISSSSGFQEPPDRELKRSIGFLYASLFTRLEGWGKFQSNASRNAHQLA
jgi:hypothetical protein